MRPEEALERYQKGFGDLDHLLDTIQVNLFYRKNIDRNERPPLEYKIMNYYSCLDDETIKNKYTGKELVDFAIDVFETDNDHYDLEAQKHPVLSFSEWIILLFSQIDKIKIHTRNCIGVEFIGKTYWNEKASLTMIREVGGNMTGTDYNAIFRYK